MTDLSDIATADFVEAFSFYLLFRL